MKKRISYSDVIRQLVDFESVALLPHENDTGAAATSYDRASYYDAETDTYVNWGDRVPWGHLSKSNADGSGFIEKYEDGSILAADIKGCGVLVRSFFATPRAGHIEIYVDGGETPVVDMPLADYVKAKGRYEGLDGLVYVTEALGNNNYVPITFNSSLKIILREGWGKYFHFSYRLFDSDTEVEPTPACLTDEQYSALREVNAILSDPGVAPCCNDGARRTVSCAIPSGASATVLETEGEGAIGELKLKINTEMSELDWYAVMQKLELSIFWDGEESPSVWAPVGDFFATAGGKCYQTLPMGKCDDGWFYCRFLMPYENGAKIVLENLSELNLAVELEMTSAALSHGIEEYGRFHAKWSMNRFLPERKDRELDYTVLKTEGRGRFLGFDLHINTNVGDKPVHWWGEGDELFFVDGEKFPSTHGTGSEDYFGYAWCRGDYFSRAFHSQNWTTTLRGVPGDYNNVRFHLLDSIGFHTGFEGAIEKTWEDEVVQYASTAYWYLDKNGTDPYTPVKYEGDDADRRYLSLKRLEEKRARQMATNVVEGEEMQILTHRGVSLQLQSLHFETKGYSRDRALIFGGMNSRVADDAYMLLSFELFEDYKGELYGYFAKGSIFGTALLSLDGKALCDPIDFYDEKVDRARTDKIALGQVDLKAGTHRLEIQIVKNRCNQNIFVLDCLVFGEE